MKRLIFILLLSTLILLTGCAVTENSNSGEMPVLPLAGAALDSNKVNPESSVEERSLTLYNNVGAVIDEVRLVNGNDYKTLAVNIQPDSTIFIQGTEQYLLNADDFAGGESPYFSLIVSGKEIPITDARLVDNEIHEQLHIDFDEIVFFCIDNSYFISPQSDYIDRNGNFGEQSTMVKYVYLPQVERWLRQREGQLLYAVGFAGDDVLSYFPDYIGDIPSVTYAAMISSETIYLEDIYVEVSDDYSIVTEIRQSNELRIFNPDDVIVVPVDHVRFPKIYFRYQDAQGNIYRQYATDQFRDNNNGSIVNHMLTPEDEYYRLVPAE